MSNKVLKNICWLLFDKVFILLLQFLIGVKIANYYGSESFGMYNYAMSIVAFSSILFELLNDRVIKKFFKEYKFANIVYNVNIFRNFMALLILIFTIILGIILKLLNLDDELLKDRKGKIKGTFLNLGKLADITVYNKTKGLFDAKTLAGTMLLIYGIKKFKREMFLPSGATLIWWSYRLLSKKGV